MDSCGFYQMTTDRAAITAQRAILKGSFLSGFFFIASAPAAIAQAIDAKRCRADIAAAAAHARPVGIAACLITTVVIGALIVHVVERHAELLIVGIHIDGSLEKLPRLFIPASAVGAHALEKVPFCVALRRSGVLQNLLCLIHHVALDVDPDVVEFGIAAAV